MILLRLYFLAVFTLLVTKTSGQNYKKQKIDNVVAEMQVVCHSDAIVLKVLTNTPFNGMVYPKDAPNSTDCVSEYRASRNMTFRLPLKSCGTLFAEADDGIEYFNTVVVQPHMRLMTNQGKGYHIRCKYQTRERTIANTHFNVSASFLMQNTPQAAAAPLLATASMPSCTMKIFRSGHEDVAETVKIGDKLIMVIEIDQQDMYGMKISNCVVRDGQNTAEQQLINDSGCPLDELIMPKFEYSNNFTRAAVSFPAHKFPHTSSVYYQCNVRLCINNGGCDQTECNPLSGAPRKKRFVSHNLANSRQVDKSRGTDMSFDVYSGLYVSDLDIGESDSSDRNNEPISTARSGGELNREEVCMTLGQVSAVLFLAGLITVCLVLLLVCQLGLTGCERQVSSAKLFHSDYLDRPSRKRTSGQTRQDLFET